MSCCKDNLLLYIRPGGDRQTVVEVLIQHINYTKDQAELALSHANKHGKCLVLEGNKEEVGKVTLALAKAGVAAEVETKSLK